MHVAEARRCGGAVEQSCGWQALLQGRGEAGAYDPTDIPQCENNNTGDTESVLWNSTAGKGGLAAGKG
eukprot:1154475-Pelagomonas_calceolata.AAC.6